MRQRIAHGYSFRQWTHLNGAEAAFLQHNSERFGTEEPEMLARGVMKPLPTHEAAGQTARAWCGQQQKPLGIQPLSCPFEDRPRFSDMLDEIKHGDNRELTFGIRCKSRFLGLPAIDPPWTEQFLASPRAKFGILDGKCVPPKFFCELCEITRCCPAIQEPFLSRGSGAQFQVAQLVLVGGALHCAHDPGIELALVMDKVRRVVNLREGLIVGLRENALQTAVWAAPMIRYVFTKTQHHSHRTGKACWHGSLLVHFKDARTTMP